MAGSWNRVNHFIIEADQMTHPIHWNPMEDKWKAWVNKNQVYNGTSHFDPKTLDAMRKLHDRILTFGGDEVCMTAFDEDAQKILSRGQFFYGGSYIRKGQDCQCHCNSANLWNMNQGRCSIATGYALSEDGLWRSVRVWETTVKRVAYFGVVLTDEECEQFWYDNG